MSDINGDTPTPGSRAGGCLLQVVTHGVALALGAVVGVIGFKMSEYYANPEILSRPEGDLSRAELISKLDAAEKAYADLLAEKGRREEQAQTEIAAASKRVEDLQSDITEKEEEVKVLQAKAKKSANKSAALKKELETKEAELVSLRAQLEVAQAEKARLESELVVSREETRMARVETDQARSETVDVRWTAFQSDALVQICEKGSRNKLSRCKEEVLAALGSTRARQYKHCLSSAQAAPRLVRTDKQSGDLTLPRWGEWVAQDSDFTRDAWYIVYCDPTLPEAQLSSDAPVTAPAPDFGE